MHLASRSSARAPIFDSAAACAEGVASVVDAVLRAAAYEDARVHFTNSGPVSARQRLLNCDRVRALLNWKPTTSLEDGIRITTAWWLANRSGWRR